MCLYLTIKGLPKKILCISYRTLYPLITQQASVTFSLLTSLLLPSITNGFCSVCGSASPRLLLLLLLLFTPTLLSCSQSRPFGITKSCMVNKLIKTSIRCLTFIFRSSSCGWTLLTAAERKQQPTSLCLNIIQTKKLVWTEENQSFQDLHTAAGVWKLF